MKLTKNHIRAFRGAETVVLFYNRDNDAPYRGVGAGMTLVQLKRSNLETASFEVESTARNYEDSPYYDGGDVKSGFYMDFTAQAHAIWSMLKDGDDIRFRWAANLYGNGKDIGLGEDTKVDSVSMVIYRKSWSNTHWPDREVVISEQAGPDNSARLCKVERRPQAVDSYSESCYVMVASEAQEDERTA